jgi:hypothetical protein
MHHKSCSHIYRAVVSFKMRDHIGEILSLIILLLHQISCWGRQVLALKGGGDAKRLSSVLTCCQWLGAVIKAITSSLRPCRPVQAYKHLKSAEVGSHGWLFPWRAIKSQLINDVGLAIRFGIGLWDWVMAAVLTPALTTWFRCLVLYLPPVANWCWWIWMEAHFIMATTCLLQHRFKHQTVFQSPMLYNS